MNKYSDFANLVVRLLKEAEEDTKRQFFDSELSDEPYKYDSDETTEFRKVLLEDSVSFEHVDNAGGEGQGNDYWSVYRFYNTMQDEVFIKFYGWYASYDGSNYDDFKVVQPQSKTITVYE